MKSGRKGVPKELEDAVWGLRSEGRSDSEIARRLGLERRRVTRLLARWGGIGPKRPRRRSGRCLDLVDREEISRGIAGKDSDRAIGSRIGRHHTTIGREIRRCGGRRRYRAHFADQEAWHRARRSKPTKLGCCPELRALVTELLRDDNSPEQISGRLQHLHPDNEAMQLSHETIYRSLFVQSKGSLKGELTRHLRSGQTKRRPRGWTRKGDGRGEIKDKLMISQRPAEVADRAVPGHWEGDLLMGNKTSAIATLVERETRYAQLVALPDGFRAEPVCQALSASITTLPEQLWRSLTWDQGKEMAEHKRFTVETGVDVYFCDPRSPWQRGTNENTNGLLRQYFPKGRSLKKVTQAELDEVAAKLNRRPRKTLGYMTPAEKLADLIDNAPEPGSDR